jgi:3-ketosteroid 9alpha-monooxygenase subunit B
MSVAEHTSPVATSYDLRVTKVVAETADAVSVTLAVPEEAHADFSYRPGQFLTVAVPSDRTGVVARCYSLSSSPDEDGPLTITVKRTAEGYASNWICDHLREGSSLRVLPPSGLFTPADLNADLLLFAGGSGITPIMSITRTALARGSGRVVLFYANRDEASVIFAAELAALAATHPDRLRVVHSLESVQGLPTHDQLRDLAGPLTSYDAFVCGPVPFMDLTTEVLRELDHPRERRHREKFLSLRGNPFGDPKARAQAAHELEEADAADAEDPGDEVLGVEVLDEVLGDDTPRPARIEIEMDGQTHVLDGWGPTTKLIEHLEANGLEPPYSCREGQCSTCAIRLLEGEVKMLNNEVLDDDDLEDGIRLACQSLPVTDVVRAEYEH